MQQGVNLPGVAPRATLGRPFEAGTLVPAETPAVGYRYRTGGPFSGAVLGAELLRQVVAPV